MPRTKDHVDDTRTDWGHSIPMILIHLTPFLALWTGARWSDWVVSFVLYWVGMFFLTAGYHRYFSHKGYKTSRVMQFVLAFGGALPANKGVLWWAANHRDHHKYSDTPLDVHSPTKGKWWSWLGWILSAKHKATNFDRVKDLAKYPELRWLNRWWFIPPTMLALGCLWFGGLSCLLIGFFLSTIVRWHSVFTINTLAHLWGRRRFNTGDGSRNNWILAITTMGEGWHNNHHHFQKSARQGFYWWEIDASWYILKVMSWFGLVWDLKEPTKEYLMKDRLGPGVFDRGLEAYRDASLRFRAAKAQAKQRFAVAIESAKDAAEDIVQPVDKVRNDL